MPPPDSLYSRVGIAVNAKFPGLHIQEIGGSVQRGLFELSIDPYPYLVCPMPECNFRTWGVAKIEILIERFSLLLTQCLGTTPDVVDLKVCAAVEITL